MGRTKLPLELIQNEKSRIQTFHKRKIGLKKKAWELSVLCNINVSIIIYPPAAAGRSSPSPPEIWPENSDALREAIAVYQSQTGEGRAKRSSDLRGFLEKKVHDEVSKRRQKVRQAMFPPWDPRIERLSREELGFVATNLSCKIEAARTRMEQIRGDRRLRDAAAAMNPPPPPPPAPVEFQMPVQYCGPPPPSDLHQMQSYGLIPPSSLTFNMLDRGFGAAGIPPITINSGYVNNGSNHYYRNLLEGSVRHEPMAGENFLVFNDLKPQPAALLESPPFLQLPAPIGSSQGHVSSQVRQFYNFSEFGLPGYQML